MGKMLSGGSRNPDCTLYQLNTFNLTQAFELPQALSLVNSFALHFFDSEFLPVDVHPYHMIRCICLCRLEFSPTLHLLPTQQCRFHQLTLLPYAAMGSGSEVPQGAVLNQNGSLLISNVEKQPRLSSTSRLVLEL